MPYHYRTPDLIAYAKGEAKITPKSDVFQLVLVAAELFTGWNPSNKFDNILDDLILSDIGHVPGDLGAGIAALIKRMLIFNPEQREGAETLLDPWEAVFKDAAGRAYSLEEQVFSNLM